MQEVFNFLRQYWRLILELCLLIAAFIIAILKKKPLGNVFTLISQYCLEAVKAAEEHSVSGEEKKQMAIDFVHECLKISYPNLDVSIYDKAISDLIENILSTPQKKGDK